MTQDNIIPRIAVVGCGYWGKNLVRNFHQLGAWALICETTPAGRTAAESIAPQIPIVDDIEAAQAGDVRSVVIAKPAETALRPDTARPGSGQRRIRRKAVGADPGAGPASGQPRRGARPNFDGRPRAGVSSGDRQAA
jgi:hypothetical protein